MRDIIAILVWLLWVTTASAQVTWHPGVAAQVPLGAYIGAPGANCASGYAYAAKVGRMPDYWTYYTPDQGTNTAGFKTAVSGSNGVPAFPDVGCYQNIIVKVRMITNDNSTVYMTYKSIAAGTFNTDYWTYLGNALTTAGFTHPIVIIGWEQNGNFYPWSDNYVVMDGGTGTGLMLPLVFNHITGAIMSIGTPNQWTLGHGYSANDVVTVDDGTCSSVPAVNILTVNGSGVPLTYSVNNAGLCSTVPGPGNWIAAFQDVSAAITAAVPGAIIAFDPNCFSGSNGWDQDYPGDSYVQMVGIDCYDQSNIVSVVAGGGAALANGNVTIANQPQTASVLHIAIVNGATPITGGTIAITYNASGAKTDTFNLATAASAQSNFFTTHATASVTQIAVANLAGGSGASKVVVVADAPAARWYYTLHESDGLTDIATVAGATANAKCAGSPSPCNSNINVTVGAAKLLGILETGTYTAGTAALNSGSATGSLGGDDPYWIDQEAQWCATNKCSVLLQFDAKPALMFGNATGYAQPGNAAAFIQDYAP